eukprot:CAMPEP_0194714824 /NCGR_PEP_ID=MMETSP0296-20130528/6503_1 /TAXON_ID=39354 /ORGANISM="Heterosigma akashiwo, Strain CCMP2393" /LENGTH=41 /DNA_ID= /DNA_START= /DNA_END= /DNA_ORIENTATION=
MVWVDRGMDLAASQGRLAMVEWLDSMASPFGRVACTTTLIG